MTSFEILETVAMQGYFIECFMILSDRFKVIRALD